MGDVGDRDMNDMTARIFRIGIGLRVHGVVVILGVGRIDRDESHLAPVLAPGKPHRLRGRRLLERSFANPMPLWREVTSTATSSSFLALASAPAGSLHFV